MSLRIRVNGKIVCAAKSNPEDSDLYINDYYHYKLSVLSKIIKPTKEEALNGVWYIKYSHFKDKKYRKFARLLLNLMQGGLCGICKKTLTEERNVDHIIPIKWGGCHTIDNLQLVHVNCNRKKGSEHDIKE